MINNDFGGGFLKNFLNRSNKNASPEDIVNRLKARANRGQDAAAAPEADAPTDTVETNRKQTYQDIINTYTRSKQGAGKNGADKTDATPAAPAPQEDEANMSPEEKRQKELADILAKIEKEEAQKNGNRYKDKNDNRPDHANNSTDNNRYKDKNSGKTDASKGSASSNVTSSVQNPSGGMDGFLNEMPLFNEFKTSLMDAFKNMDSGSSGMIRAQYELNYSSMQAIANAAGGFEYEETTVNVKFDLNYVKAANGGTSGEEIAEAIEGATDFASLMDAL
jgi:hypothetical protein